MQKIVPSIWFDHNAGEAAAFYTRVFPNARVTGVQYYPKKGLPDFQREFAGKELAVEFELDGHRFVGINAGPEFPVTPAISFMVNFDPSLDDAARSHLEDLWNALADSGQVMMPLGEYPFSSYYGWVQDKYGVGWQLILTDPAAELRPYIVPSLLFGAEAQNRAAEAADYYTSVFPDGWVGTTATYPQPTGPATTDSVMYCDIELFGQWFALMDSGVEQTQTFSPGVSFMIECADQAEIDRYWAELSTVPEAEQCGWLVDRFGVSWQVVPTDLAAYTGTTEGYLAMLSMKKIQLDQFA